MNHEYCVLSTSAAYIRVHVRLDYIIQINTKNSDQTARKSNLGSYCLQYRATYKNISRR